MKQRLALYGGTFDPVHHGHLILARDAMELLNLDRVIFVPAALSPHKLDTRPVAASLRHEMLCAAVQDEPSFIVDDQEIHREGPSFTIDTVEQVHARHPDAELHYLIGHDNVPELHTWRRIDDLRALVQFVVFGRGENDGSHSFPTLSRRVDISATEIRTRVASGRSIRYLVPEPVRQLIEKHHLYQESSPSLPNN